jgi:hypothetical protein
LNSATFRQSGDTEDALRAEDRLLGHFPAFRLDAESIRDALLLVSGELDTAMGGPPVAVSTREDGAVVVAESRPGARRRSVYLQQKRTQVVSLLQLFDTPTIVFNSLRRPRTAMPLQSLLLMNSDFVRARAHAFASRMERERSDEAERLAAVFLTAYARSPSGEEESAARGFLDAQENAYGQGTEARKKAWVDLCQSIFMSNEFLYLD